MLPDKEDLIVIRYRTDVNLSEDDSEDLAKKRLIMLEKLRCDLPERLAVQAARAKAVSTRTERA